MENSERDRNIRSPDLPPKKSASGQEAKVRTGHGTVDWFQTGKRVFQGCILLPCLFNLYTEHILRNSGLDEAHAGIKIARRWEGGSCLGTHVRIKDFKIKKIKNLNK